MLSNHNTELINELYKDYNIHLIGKKEKYQRQWQKKEAK